MNDSVILQAVTSYRFYPHSPHCLTPSHQECVRAAAAADLMRAVEVMSKRAKLPSDAANVVTAAQTLARVVLGNAAAAEQVMGHGVAE